MEAGSARATDHRGAALDDDAGRRDQLRLQEHPQPGASTLLLGPARAVRPVVRRAGREGRRDGGPRDGRRALDRQERSRHRCGDRTRRRRLRRRHDRLRGHRTRHRPARKHGHQWQAAAPQLGSAETAEYLAHLIPEGGYRGIPNVYGPGYLVCGDAAMLSNPVHREGSNLAMESGRLAGETVIHCKELGDFSERRLAEYRGRLDHSWIMADMKKYDQAVPLLEHNPQMLTKYPQVLDRALDEFFRVDGTSKWDKQKNILKMLRKEGLFRMGWDTFKALWAMK